MKSFNAPTPFDEVAEGVEAVTSSAPAPSIDPSKLTKEEKLSILEGRLSDPDMKEPGSAGTIAPVFPYSSTPEANKRANKRREDFFTTPPPPTMEEMYNPPEVRELETRPDVDDPGTFGSEELADNTRKGILQDRVSLAKGFLTAGGEYINFNQYFYGEDESNLDAQQKRELHMSSKLEGKPLSLEAKYRIMYQENATEIMLNNPDGSFKTDDQGNPLSVELESTLRQKARTKLPGTIGERAYNFIGEAVFSAPGPLANQDLTERLTKLGVGNTGVIHYLDVQDEYGYGKSTEFKVAKELTGIYNFSKLPLDVVRLVGILNASATGVVLDAVDYVFTKDGERTNSDLASAYEALIRYGTPDAPQMEQILSSRHDVDVRVLQNMLQPTGVVDRFVKMYTEYGGIYGALASNHAAKSRTVWTGFDKAATTRFGGENFGQAMNNAYKEGVDYHTFKMAYIEEQIKNSRFKAWNAGIMERRLETGKALAASTPEARKQMGIVQDEIASIDSQITKLKNKVTEDQLNNNKAAVLRGNGKIDALYARQRKLTDEIIIPPVIKSMQADLGIQTSLVATSVEGYTQLFGNDPSVTPYVEMATSFAIGMQWLGVATVNWTPLAAESAKNRMKSTWEWMNKNKDGFQEANTTEKLLMIKQSKELDKLTKATLVKIARSPREFQEIMIAGSVESAALRDDLISLSRQSGVKIDENKFLNTLGDVANMGGLITLARTLDQKITVTGFNSALPMLLKKESGIQNQRLIVTQMASSIRELTRALSATDDPDSYKSARVLQRMLINYVSQAEGKLVQDEMDVENLLAVTGADIEAIHMGSADVVTGGMDAARTVSELFDFQTRSLKMGIDSRVPKEYGLTDQQVLAQRAKDLDDVASERSIIIKQAGSGLTPETANTGNAGVHAALAFVHVNDYYFNKGNQLYNVAAESARGAYADISVWGMDILSNPTLFKDVIPDTRGVRTLQLKEGKLTGRSKVAFNALLLDSAERSASQAREVIDANGNGGTYDEIIARLSEKDGLDADTTLTALDEFALLSKFAATPQGKAVLPGGLPLLITFDEWKDVRLTISDAIGKDPSQQYYKTLKENWDRSLGDVNGETSFKRGWFTGEEPENVSAETYTSFMNAQNFWADNVIGRSTDYAGKFRNLLSEGRVKRLTQEGVTPTDVVAEYGKENLKDQPIYFLNNVFQGATKTLSERVNSGQPLVGVELQTLLEAPIAKISGGVRDENGVWRIVVSDKLDEGSKIGEYGKEMQRSVRLWLQAGLLNTKAMQSIRREDALGLSKLGDLKDKAQIENLINSLGRIQVYQRNEDGSLTPQMIEGYSTPRMFLYPSEIHAVTDLNSVTDITDKARIELAKVKSLWNEQKKALKNKMTLGLKAQKNEITRDKVTIKAMGLDVDKDIGNYSKIAQDVYENVADGGLNVEALPRLKERVASGIAKSSPGASPTEVADLTNEFIGRYTAEYIVTSSTVETGATMTVYSEKFGRNFSTPEIGINHVQLANALKTSDPVKSRQIREILNWDGKKRYELLEAVVRIGARLSQTNVAGINAHIPSLSLDSILSRGYNLNREVVSPQYTAIELILRSSRESGARALEAMLNNPALAIRVMEALEDGGLEQLRRTEVDFKNLMLAEIIRQENANSFATDNISGKSFLLKQPIAPNEVDEGLDSVIKAAPTPFAQPPKPTQKVIQKTGIPAIDKLRGLGFRY